MFFSGLELAVWRNRLVWADEDWYELPGPAQWWPKDYDFVGHDWEDGIWVDPNLAHDAYDVIATKWTKKFFPVEEIERLDPSMSELIMRPMEENIYLKSLQK
jgi:hypothetical protein